MFMSQLRNGILSNNDVNENTGVDNENLDVRSSLDTGILGLSMVYGPASNNSNKQGVTNNFDMNFDKT